MENQGKYWDLYQQIKDLKKKQKKQLHKLYIDFALLSFFEWTIEKNLKNFTKTIAKLKKLYYNLHEVEKSGTKWQKNEKR